MLLRADSAPPSDVRQNPSRRKKTLQIQCADVDEVSERVQTNKGWWLELHYIHLSDAGVQIVAQYGYFSRQSGKKWPITGKKKKKKKKKKCPNHLFKQ